MDAAYATYFDSNFLARGLALYRSLRRHEPAARLVVLALDDGCAGTLRRLKESGDAEWDGLDVLPLAELEAADPELAAARADRSPIEYYFTCTPTLCRYILAMRGGGLDRLTYLDADLYFFASPATVHDEAGDAPIAVIEHRYPPRLHHLAERYGRFNVGWITFRRDATALACLDDWRRRCLAWCRDEPGPEGFADQKYLDDWPARFAPTHVVAAPGANVAPWNVEGMTLSRDRTGRVLVGGAGEPLILYHFHALRRRGVSDYETDFRGFGRLDRPLLDLVYRPYLDELAAVDGGLLSIGNVSEGRLVRFDGPLRGRGWIARTKRQVLRLRSLAQGEWVVFRGSHPVGPGTQLSVWLSEWRA